MKLQRAIGQQVDNCIQKDTHTHLHYKQRMSPPSNHQIMHPISVSHRIAYQNLSFPSSISLVIIDRNDNILHQNCIDSRLISGTSEIVCCKISIDSLLNYLYPSENLGTVCTSSYSMFISLFQLRTLVLCVSQLYDMSSLPYSR